MVASRARVASLQLRDFRNVEALALEGPEDGFVLIGDNGAGKTNILESVYYVSLLRSARGARDVDVVRFGADGFFVEADVCVREPHTISVGFDLRGRRKRVRRDGAVIDRLSDALGALPAVMFSPGDVTLVSGPPSARRRFLDIMLALSSRAYLYALQLYRAALDRRNATIRDAARSTSRGSAAIEAWEPQLAEHGAVLWRSRREWVARVAAGFSERCTAIGERGHAELGYQSTLRDPDDDLASALLRALASGRAGDLRQGVTRVGPHRDDLGLALDGRDLRTFGSAGQQRTAAIALRTLEAETLRDACAAAPVFLLDDPFAELDAGRAERVLALLHHVGLGQTILAVPRDTDIPRELTDLQRMRVVGGRVRVEGSA